MKSQSPSNDRWKRKIAPAAVRRTIEIAIKKALDCDEKTAALEFDRALSRGELEETKIGLSKEMTAYKLKEQ